jgi:1-hydroxycarotenoid 3,4-desaturase
MRMRHVVIIGAGVGGLSAALRLAAAGVKVTVVESAPNPGGKMREVMASGVPIDSGPTVFTMRWVFEELAADVGLSLDDHIRCLPARTLARHGWSDGARLDLFADLDQSVAAIEAFSGAQDAQAFRAFAARAQGIYATLKDSFIRASRPNLLQLSRRIGLSRLGELMRLSPYSTLAGALAQSFRDPRLRQLFARYATYCGSSPYAAPATLMLVAHVEREGVWLIEGGMQRLAEGLAAMGERFGATYLYQRHAARILVEGGRACGVELSTGERLAADAVIMNGDVMALGAGLLGPDVTGAVSMPPPTARFLSAVTWSMQGKAQGFPLLRHNVFFSDAYRAEFDDILIHGRAPRAPTVYVCAQDRGDQSPAPGAEPQNERLFCLINAPANGDGAPLKPSDLQSCEEATFRHLERCGLKVTPLEGARVVTTPADFARMFPASGGALYGPAQHGWVASFTRPGARSRLPGLYLAGGGVHPGPGVPMAALSGRQAALSVMADLNLAAALTAPSTP